MPQNNQLSIFCDGGSRGNPGPAASAFVVIDSFGEKIYEHGISLGITTNNHAEYSAVLSAITWLSSSTMSQCEITFYLDSLLVINQMLGNYKIKDPNLFQLYQKIQNIIRTQNLKITNYVHIPRVQNSKADLLVNLTLDKLQK